MNRSLRVVVADDEPEMLTYFRETLEELGHRVIADAANGRDLVERCIEEHPDLVITDIRMPDLDGIDAATEIYQNVAIPVILVSAYHDPELLDRAEVDHIMAYLIKPMKSAHLEAAIGLAVRRFAQFELLKKETGDLKKALEDRKVIERAKGILMKQAGLGEEEAFKRLQDLASNRNQKMVEIAKIILTMRDALEPKKKA